MKCLEFFRPHHSSSTCPHLHYRSNLIPSNHPYLVSSHCTTSCLSPDRCLVAQTRIRSRSAATTAAKRRRWSACAARRRSATSASTRCTARRRFAPTSRCRWASWRSSSPCRARRTRRTSSCTATPAIRCDTKNRHHNDQQQQQASTPHLSAEASSLSSHPI